METLDGDVSDLVRDEDEQATEVGELLDLYAAEGVDGAFVYNFIEPDNTWSPDPLQDLDKTGFSLVKCFGPESDDQAHEPPATSSPRPRSAPSPGDSLARDPGLAGAILTRLNRCPRRSTTCREGLHMNTSIQARVDRRVEDEARNHSRRGGSTQRLRQPATAHRVTTEVD